jgi:peptidoglycan/LPS O-acetylase OafA/YrhL
MMSPRHTFVVLDGLRGIAAMAIAARHCPLIASISQVANVPCGWDSLCRVSVGPLFESYLAVDFFFGLSGFVLAYAYEGRLRHGMTPCQFILERLIRLYPVYVIGLAIGCIIPTRAVIGGQISFEQLFATVGLNVFFLPAPPSADPSFLLFPLNAVAWSLFFELIANVVYALVAYRLRTRILFVLVGLSSLALMASAAHYGNLDGGGRWTDIMAGFTRVLFSFFAGGLVFRLWRRTRNGGMFLHPFVSCLALVTMLGIRPSEFLSPIYDEMAVVIGFPMLIYWSAKAAPSRGLNRLFAILGAVSYPLYVIHYPTYILVGSALAHFSFVGSEAPIGIALIVCLTIIALMIHYHYDEPARAALKSLLKTTNALSP